MNFRILYQAAALLCVPCAFAQSPTYRVEFPQAHYDVAALQEFTTPVRINPVPAAGLFSYGLVCSVEGSNGLTGIVAMTPLSTLAFDGVVGAGTRGVTSLSGKYTGKGSVDIQLPQKSNHTDPNLGTIAIAGLPAGNYTLSLGNYNTLGPTESVFVDGQSHSLDSQITFGSATLSVVASPVGTITAFGAMRLDRQTGLLIQQYDVKNTGAIAAVFRILIKNIPTTSKVWNAQGKINGVPYIDLPAVLAVGATTRITIEYFSQDRKTVPSPVFELIGASGTPVNPEGVTTTLKPRATLSGGNVLLEFNTETGKSYYIQYSSDLATWKTALPKVDGTGNRIQWIDNGSPKTESHPSAVSSRFYRILATTTAHP
jgi:hypothetical protein